MIERFGGTHRTLRESGRFGRRIGIKRGPFHIPAARPKPRADYLVRIGFPRDGVGANPFRSAPSREPCRRQIEAAPEKMHGARFSDKPGAKLFENGFAADEDPPEAVGVFGIIRSVLRVLIERN